METAVFVKIASENNCGGRKELKNSKIIHTLERGMWYDGSMNRRRVSISGFLLSFFPLLYDFSPERRRSVRKGANVAVPCVGPFLLWQNRFLSCEFYSAFFFSYALRGTYLSLHVFTSRDARPTPFGGDIFRCAFFTYRSTFPTPFGDPIFRCTTKDRGERRAKGIAIPLNPLELIVTANRTCFVPAASQRCI